ncbi:MAG: general secretion pathway protein GspB [Methylomonas sp.]
MSYILNALRKSEKERQAIEPETVTARIVMYQAPQHRGSNRLIAALIVINLAVLAYFLSFRDKTANDTTPPSTAVIKSLDSGRAEPVRPLSAVDRPVEPEKSSIAKIVAARSAESAAPIDKPAVAKKQAVEPVIQSAEALTSSPAKPAASTKGLTIEPANPAPAPQQLASEPLESSEEDTQPLAQISAPIIEPASASASAPKPLPVQAKNDLPFLDELPAEFGRSLPDLRINVFSYAPAPAERFIMIDMVKYIPGQRIKDQLELKEIRPDSIVVSYDGRTFKIKRP